MTQPKQLLIFKRMKSIKGSMETNGKVFCRGSEELKKVITKLIDDKLVAGPALCKSPSFFTHASYSFALSIFAERDEIPNKLGYAFNWDFYSDNGYIEVSPQEFDKWWRNRFENKEVKSTNSEVDIVTTKLELSKKSPLKILI